MKTFIALMMFVVSSAFAAEMIVLDVPAGDSASYDRHTVKFVIDQTTGTGSASLLVEREHQICSGDAYDSNCSTWYTNMVSAKEVIVGINVVDKKVTFEDRINCGKMGVSRIFNRPTFFMTGNCTLSYDRVNVSGEKRILVKLITKE